MVMSGRVAGDATKKETAGVGPAKALFYPRAGTEDRKLFFSTVVVLHRVIRK
jgi:hypothetical protein